MFVIGCTSSITVVHEPQPAEPTVATIQYADFWTAFRYGDVEQMVGLAYLPEQHVLTRAFTYGTQRKWREAVTLLDSLCRTSGNDTIQHFSGLLLNQSRRLLGAWAEICSDTCRTSPDTMVQGFECLYTQEPFMDIIWGNNADTIAISIKRGIPIVPVVIHGKQYEFIFDTGAQHTALYGSVARESILRMLAEQEYKVGSSTGRIHTARAGFYEATTQFLQLLWLHDL